MGLFGKLFEKKECSVCGGEIGLLGNRKLEDGNPVSYTHLQNVEHPDLMDYGVGTIRLKKVVNTEETTTITVQVYISETYLPQGRKPHTRKYKRTLVLQRARYPQRRKQDGKLFTERECPSCGANFVPDENHCCSFCGYSFQADSAKWVVQTCLLYTSWPGS